MIINGNTKIVGLIGHPVEHTFSPQMHNSAFSKLKMNYIYAAFDVKPENLEKAIKNAEALDIKGFNVTIPHKVNVIQYLNDIDETAKQIGAVNTIDFKNLKGYNTDGLGAVKAIEEITKVKNKNILIAGAGGASRAIAFYLKKNNVNEITILNRNIQKAQNLADELEASSDSISQINKYMENTDILINTTPIGMYPNINDTPITNAENMHEEQVVFDAVYNPNKTQLLNEAIKAAAKPVYGIKMLLYQGAESFRIWTGKKPPIKTMEETLKKTLGQD